MVDSGSAGLSEHKAPEQGTDRRGGVSFSIS